MDKYNVEIKEIDYATVVIEAASAEEAEAKAQALYESGTLDWDDCDISIYAYEI